MTALDERLALMALALDGLEKRLDDLKRENAQLRSTSRQQEYGRSQSTTKTRLRQIK